MHHTSEVVNMTVAESSDALTAIKEAHNQKATTLSITNSDKSSIVLERYCFSQVSATAVIEILYLILTMMKDDAH